jgi:hypothetical protein
VVDLENVRVADDGASTITFELPLRSESAEFPREKFQATFRVNKANRSFEEITINLREAFRVAGVVKITDAGLHARFQILDPANAPQPVLLRGGGIGRLLLVKVSRDFEATRTDFRRVVPFAAPTATGD